MSATAEASSKLFGQLRNEIAALDPVAFAEAHLTIDGRPFRMTGNGWKWNTELYREVAAQATSVVAKPMVVLKGRQVGATILAAVLSLYFTASGMYGGQGKAPMRILHVFPTLGIMARYAKDKLMPMMQGSQNGYIASRSLGNDKKYGKEAGDDTITEKSFIGFNKLRVDAIGKNADRLRGLTQDGILFDEVQDMGKTAIENALRILTKANYGKPGQGIQLFFGTPKNAGSHFWHMWQDSDQRYFQPRCISCGEYFFFYTIGSDEWRKIWVKGFDLECPHCGHHQDKREAIEGGRWHPSKNSAECRFVGYHVNLMLSPDFTKEMVLDLDPSVNRNRSERAWKNETLGEFFAGGGAPLSMDEICWDETRALAKSVRDASDKVYTMGIDWGDKSDLEEAEDEGDEPTSSRGQSYTVIAITSIDRRGVFTLENAYRLPQNDFAYKLEVIQELVRRFRVRQIVADYMWGNDIVQHFQTALNWGEKFVGAVNSGNVSAMLSYKPKEFRVMINKNLMIDEIFGMFRRDKIVFPGKGESYDRLYWLALHCTSMELGTAQRYGSLVKVYKKGLGPNDGLMAIMYAVVAGKFIMTGGFKNNNQNGLDAGKAPLPVLAYLPSKM